MSNSITEPIIGGADKTLANVISQINKGFDDVVNCILDLTKTTVGTINLGELFGCDKNGLVTIESGDSKSASVKIENAYSQYCKGDIGLKMLSTSYKFTEDEYPYIKFSSTENTNTEVSIARQSIAHFSVLDVYYYGSGTSQYVSKKLTIETSLNDNSELDVKITANTYSNKGGVNGTKFFLGAIDLIYELNR